MEERSRKEHNEQDTINQQIQTSVKNMAMRVTQVDQKIVGVDQIVGNIVSELSKLSPGQNWSGIIVQIGL